MLFNKLPQVLFVQSIVFPRQGFIQDCLFVVGKELIWASFSKAMCCGMGLHERLYICSLRCPNDIVYFFLF